MKTALFFTEPPRSDELPDGALTKVSGVRCLQRTLDRCKGIKSVSSLNYVMGTDSYSKALGAVAEKLGVTIHFDQGEDHLDQICNSARLIGADYILLASANALFLDPWIADRLIDLAATNCAEYGTMDMPPSWPYGLDLEVVSVRRLRQASIAASSAEDRANPTRWVRHNPAIKKANFTGPGRGLQSLRWVLETRQDLDFLETLHREVGPRISRFSTSELYGLMLRRPDLAKMSRNPGEKRKMEEPILVDVPSQPFALRPAA